MRRSRFRNMLQPGKPYPNFSKVIVQAECCEEVTGNDIYLFVLPDMSSEIPAIEGRYAKRW